MPAPTLHVFTLPDGKKTTSIVMDHDEFVEFIKSLPITPEQVQRVIVMGCLPLMSRGARTGHFFDKYGVTTDYLSVIIRGTAAKLAEVLPQGFQDMLTEVINNRARMNKSEYN